MNSVSVIPVPPSSDARSGTFSGGLALTAPVADPGAIASAPVWASVNGMEQHPMVAPWEVHVWTVPLVIDHGICDGDPHVLSDDEMRRAERFHFERDRWRFIIAHAALRRLLGRYLRVAPAELEFTCNAFGKPAAVLPPGAPSVQFNLSHSEDLALVVVSGGAAVGVDCERVCEDAAILDLAEKFFAPGEIRQIRAKPRVEQCAAFYRCWTRKEALIKGVGSGLSFPLDAFCVDVDTRSAQRPRNERVPLMVPPGWIVMDVPVSKGYEGALAVLG